MMTPTTPRAAPQPGRPCWGGRIACSRLLAAALLIGSASAVHPPRPAAGVARHTAVQRATPPALCAEPPNISDKALPTDDSATEDDDGSIVRGATEELQTREFTSDLYAHLQKRPDYETSELYKSLRSRVDVSDPIVSEMAQMTDRGAAVPTAGQTPTEILDLVLLALREDRESSGNVTAGVETLMRFSGPGSSIHMGGKVTPAMLLTYFRDSKYKVLLDWVSVSYPKKLELSFDKTKAVQQTKLKLPSGEWVPVTFQFKKHEVTGGPIWMLDQVLVKSESDS